MTIDIVLHKVAIFLGTFRTLVWNRVCYCFNISTNYMCPSFTMVTVDLKKYYNNHVCINLRFTQSVYAARVILSSDLPQRRHRLLISTYYNKNKHSVVM